MEERLNVLDNSSVESDEYDKNCKELSKDVSSGKIKILDVVTQLQSLLVHTFAERRAHGTHILSSLIKGLPLDYLTCEELHFLSQFYADRTKDNHQVIPPLLKGVLALTHMKNINEESMIIILTAFFDNIPCQQQQVKDRFIIYNILKEFSHKFPNGVELMGLTFVIGLISAMDGERDPLNLKYLFSWLPTILKKLKLAHLAEEMFEVIACYFPVDFRAPPSNSPDAVSREDLANTLKDCLCSVPEFGEWCIPLILEKLDSTLQIAKLDSIQLLVQGSTTFDHIVLESHSIELIKSLRKEAIETQDVDVQDNAFKAITSLFKVYENSPATLENLFSMIDTSINQLLINDKIFDGISRFLSSICRGSLTACKHITTKIIPLLLSALVSETREVEIFRALVDISAAQAEICGEIDENVLETFFRATVHKKMDVRTIAFTGITKLTNYFNDSQRERLYMLLSGHICEPNEKSVRESILSCLENVYILNGSILLQKVFDNRAKQFDNGRLLFYLEASSRLTLIDDPAKHHLLPEIVEQSFHPDKVRSLIALNQLELLLNKNDQVITNILHNQLDLVGRTIGWVMEGNVNDPVLIQRAATAYSMLIGGLSLTEQVGVIDRWYLKVLEPCVNQTNPPETRMVLLEAMMIRLRPGALMELPREYDINNLLNTLLKWMWNKEIQLYIIRLIASILNKINKDDVYLDSISMLINDSESQPKHTLVIIWVTKALLLKGSPISNEWIEKLVDHLDLNPNEVIEGFKFIMDENCLYLNKYSHCNIKLLYRQRFFGEVLKRLKTEKPEHLAAIGELLGSATSPLLRLHAKDVQRPLFICLQQCQESGALRGALSALLVLLQEKHPSLQQHADALLKPLLQLASDSPFMMVRADALRCIHEISDGFPLHNLLPHKSQVLAALAPCLDDKKRLVRRYAVNARAAWFIIDAPT